MSNQQLLSYCRPLSPEEITQFLREYTRATEWRIARSVAWRYFGEKYSSYLSVASTIEYLDDGTSYYTSSVIVACDANHMHLPPDISLSWYPTFCEQLRTKALACCPFTFQDLEDCGTDQKQILTCIERYICETYIAGQEPNLPPDPMEYDLYDRPTVPWSTIMVPTDLKDQVVLLDDAAIVAQSDAIDCLNDWEIVHQLVTGIYGERARFVHVLASEQYNDEGEYNDELAIDEVIVCGQTHCALLPDPSLSWFQALERAARPEIQQTIARARARGTQALQDLASTYGFQLLCGEDEDGPSPFPRKQMTYDLSTKPLLPYTHVYGIKRQEEDTHAS